MDRRPLTVLLVMALTSCCSRAEDESLAAAGRIDREAPIISDQSIAINAHAPVIWHLLVDIDHWPDWQPAISQARLQGTLAVGHGFGWTNGDTEVESRLALLRPARAVAWTGRAQGLHAIHVWTLSARADGRVEVRTQESMRGLTSPFYSSGELAHANNAWLRALKKAAEMKSGVAAPH